MNILFAASECFPLIKTGGLADVAGALPLALEASSANVTVFLPGYPAVMAGLKSAKTAAVLKNIAGAPAKLVSGMSSTGLTIIALDAPHLFGHSGNPYQDAQGRDREGNAVRFAAFSKVAAQIASGAIKLKSAKTFDVLHAHDWQAGLAAAYLKATGDARVKTVITIHNLAFQGLFPKTSMEDIDLPQDYFTSGAVEYWDQVSFLKAAITFSDHVTTVSPTYALEIQSDSGGMGFGGLLRAKHQSLSGILNGIDESVWSPETDSDIAAPYSATKLSGKALCKTALQKEFSLRMDKKAPLFCVISRLTTQKGLDLLSHALDHIVARGGQLAVLGSGDAAIEQAFKDGAAKHPSEIAVHIGYDEPMAHRLQAGADAIFIPSRFEPCGLTQLCAMRYGTVPVVARVGGLNDTVINASPMALASGVATGLQFSPVDGHMLAAAIDKAIDLYTAPKTWKRIVRNGMRQDVGWETSAAAYLDLYRSL